MNSSNHDIKIVAHPIDVNECINKVKVPEAGGIDVFIGTVRAQTKGEEVIRLEFEAYEKMALLEMEKIAGTAISRWPLHRILICHRVGVLKVGEIPVVIAVSAAHRAAAFDACRYIIDTLKETVPIWKKEVFANGESWVNAHP